MVLDANAILMLRFNLVIEVLVVSRRQLDAGCTAEEAEGFNLVIEVLVVSRLSTGYPLKARISCFNLVIEVLVVSSSDDGSASQAYSVAVFQSRSRGTCRFKSPCTAPLPLP